jgi:hypothetical protein
VTEVGPELFELFEEFFGLDGGDQGTLQTWPRAASMSSAAEGPRCRRGSWGRGPGAGWLAQTSRMGWTAAQLASTMSWRV